MGKKYKKKTLFCITNFDVVAFFYAQNPILFPLQINNNRSCNAKQRKQINLSRSAQFKMKMCDFFIQFWSFLYIHMQYAYRYFDHSAYYWHFCVICTIRRQCKNCAQINKYKMDEMQLKLMLLLRFFCCSLYLFWTPFVKHASAFT